MGSNSGGGGLVGFVGERTGSVLLPGGAVGLQLLGVPVAAADRDDHFVPGAAEGVCSAGDHRQAGRGVPGGPEVPAAEVPGPPPPVGFEELVGAVTAGGAPLEVPPCVRIGTGTSEVLGIARPNWQFDRPAD